MKQSRFIDIDRWKAKNGLIIKVVESSAVVVKFSTCSKKQKDRLLLALEIAEGEKKVSAPNNLPTTIERP